MRAIEINGAELKELIDELPLKFRKKLISMMKDSNHRIDRVKKFVDQYDKNCPIDQMISHTIGILIDKIGSKLSDLVHEQKKKGKHATGLSAAAIVIEALKSEAEEIQAVIDHHKCDDDCEHD